MDEVRTAYHQRGATAALALLRSHRCYEFLMDYPSWYRSQSGTPSRLEFLQLYRSTHAS